MRILTIALLACLLFSTACYEDGPCISFRSKAKRVTGTWSSAAVWVDGYELENEGGFRSIEFKADGSYIDTKGDSICGLYINQGTWAFSDDDKFLILSIHDTYTDTWHSLSWEIKKLAYKELRLVYSGTAVTEWWLERVE
jgi:hypothetical protein